MENEQKVRIHAYYVLLTYRNHPHRASGMLTRVFVYTFGAQSHRA